jgi:hypothetical protein
MTTNNPRTVYEEREIYHYQSTEGIIADLQAALEEGFTSFDVETYHEYGDCYAKIVVSRRRPETKEEKDARELTENLRAQEQFNRERAEYEKLKAKFGNL